MDAIVMIDIIEKYYGYKYDNWLYRPSKKVIYGALYGAFKFVGAFDDENDITSWKFGIKLGDGIIISNFLGEKCCINNSVEDICRNLKLIDNYCRLRLTDEYLNKYKDVYDN